MEILGCVIISVGFLFIGIHVGKKLKKVDGLFIVDDSDYEVTRWRIDVNFDPKDLINKKEIRLKVKKMDVGDV